jgi:hypothetical protein
MRPPKTWFDFTFLSMTKAWRQAAWANAVAVEADSRTTARNFHDPVLQEGLIPIS